MIRVEPNEVFEWHASLTAADVEALHARRDEPGQDYYLVPGKTGTAEPVLRHVTQ